MSGAATPPVLLEPIANSAASGTGAGDKTNPMPDAPTGTNSASIRGGFPAITMQTKNAGGEPPLGQDVNGFLYLVSSHTFFLQCGQLYPYNSALATAVGGYAQGAVLAMADGTGTWLNTISGNTSNPDTGGAGWVALSSYGVATPSSTGGTLTLTAAQSRYTVIAISGALTSNLTVVLPNIARQWLIANLTTGAFTLTVKSSGVLGVTVPAGGFGSPVGVYCVGDGNIYPTVSPLSVPIDQNPNPLTLVERTNLGYVLATYLNQSSAHEEPFIGAVFVENTAQDGYLRKCPLDAFANQLFGTGALSNPGSYTFPIGPNGLTLKWGSIFLGDVISPPSVFISFPGAPFTTFVHVFPSLSDANGTHASAVPGIDGTPSLSGFTATAREIASTIQSCTYHWFAIGV